MGPRRPYPTAHPQTLKTLKTLHHLFESDSEITEACGNIKALVETGLARAPCRVDPSRSRRSNGSDRGHVPLARGGPAGVEGLAYRRLTGLRDCLFDPAAVTV